MEIVITALFNFGDLICMGRVGFSKIHKFEQSRSRSQKFIRAKWMEVNTND